jgi:uroporphyrin-III C-methyltransferase
MVCQPFLHSPVTMKQPAGVGTVILVGGSPGGAGLLTVAGLEAIKEAGVIVCDRLAPLAAPQHTRPEAAIIDVAKIPETPPPLRSRSTRSSLSMPRPARQWYGSRVATPLFFGPWRRRVAGLARSPAFRSRRFRRLLGYCGPGAGGCACHAPELTQGCTAISGHAPPGDPTSTLKIRPQPLNGRR